MALSRISWPALVVGASILLTTHYLNTRALAQSSNVQSTTQGIRSRARDCRTRPQS